ncbi:hypothetical protein EKO04_007069 [Ascochyta lentis]|uniref:Uncharacterized protein n=1 Tax=Ascochyta lentis TaxID=205686 RepID=A0A8H7J2I8_9PLEO|nr:hypothetical protein EKO04_007069 [Ascochyta lentis]
MENLDELFILDALALLLAMLAWPFKWLLPPFLALLASLYIPLFDTPAEFSPFFYVSTLLATFFFGMCMSRRGSEYRLVWAVAIIVVCASVLGARMANNVEEQLRVVEDQGLQVCFEGWKMYDLRLADVGEQLRACREKAAFVELAETVGTDGVEVCDVQNRCRNTGAGLLIRV